jgi:hypothetical protein
VSRGRNNKLVGQIGEHLVCAELGRRGLIATPFSGNVPTFDVLATDEQCRTVPIQVKSSTTQSWKSDAQEWMRIQHNAETRSQEDLGPLEIQNPDLIYVCVSIAHVGDERDRFFILKKSDLQQVCIKNYRAWMAAHNWKRPRNPGSTDLRYDVAGLVAFESNWQLIVDRIELSHPELRIEH